jgi:hypothetical protein
MSDIPVTRLMNAEFITEKEIYVMPASVLTIRRGFFVHMSIYDHHHFIVFSVQIPYKILS